METISAMAEKSPTLPEDFECEVNCEIAFITQPKTLQKNSMCGVVVTAHMFEAGRPEFKPQ